MSPPSRAQALTEHKQRLLLRSAELRVEMQHEARALQAPLAVADQAVAVVQWLRARPLVPLGALVSLTVLRPRRVLRWTSRLWWGWGMVRQVRAWLLASSSRRP